MPRINTYTDNTSIEDDDKLLTYDTQGAATKLTAFSRIWTWIQSKIHAITASTSAWTAANDKVVVDRNGTLSRIDYSILAKAIVESYNGSTLAGSAQAVKTAIDALNSKVAATNLPNTIYCVKVGKVCYLTFEHSTVFTAEADATICTLPTGFRPNYAVSFVCPLTGYRISVGISGIISCNHALNENVLRGGITYIISD